MRLRWLSWWLTLAVPLAAQAPTRPALVGLDHVAFKISDADAAQRFYGDLLGYAVVHPRMAGAPLLGTTTEHITTGKMTYDLRRLRAHGLIARIPHTRRYQVTDTGLSHALLLTHAHDHLLRAGLDRSRSCRHPVVDCR